MKERSKMREMMNCPFCGSECERNPIRIDEGRCANIKCFAHNRWWYLIYWNQRAPNTSTIAEREALKELGYMVQAMKDLIRKTQRCEISVLVKEEKPQVYCGSCGEYKSKCEGC